MAVRQAFQKARRNVNKLQKVADGIYKVKASGDLVMVEVDPRSLEPKASFTQDGGQVVT